MKIHSVNWYGNPEDHEDGILLFLDEEKAQKAVQDLNKGKHSWNKENEFCGYTSCWGNPAFSVTEKETED